MLWYRHLITLVIAIEEGVVDIAIQTDTERVQQNVFIENLPTVHTLLDAVVAEEQRAEVSSALLLLNDTNDGVQLITPPPLPLVVGAPNPPKGSYRCLNVWLVQCAVLSSALSLFPLVYLPYIRAFENRWKICRVGSQSNSFDLCKAWCCC